MATDLTFRISAIDNASRVAERVQRSFSNVSAPLDKMTGKFRTVGRSGVAAISRAEAALGKIANTARVASDRIASIVPGMTALTGLVGGAGGIGALAERWGNLGFHLKTTSRMLGMSAQGLQAWHFAAQRAGVTAQQFDQSVMSSQNTIRMAAYGGNPQAMMLLNRLGVNISHGKNGAIDYQKTQADIMTALGRIRDPVGQRTAAESLGMGGILPMIQRGTYDQDRRQAIADGYAPSPAAIQRAAQFRDIMFGFNTQMSDLGNTIGITLTPILEPMVRNLTTWLNSHRLAIAQAFGDAVKKFSDWITSVNWGDLWDKVNSIVDKFGGWGAVLRDIVAIKFASVVAGWVAPIAALAANLLIAKKAAGAIKGMAGGVAVAEGAGAPGGGMGLLGKIGITWLASDIALQVARALGLPDTNTAKGNEDTARGNWLKASFDLPAGDFLSAGFKRVFGAGHPIGIRSNNPLNILRKGQERTYATPEAGISAAVSNLRTGYRGLTVAQIADKWTGGARTGNTPEQMRNYIGLLTRGTGLAAGDRPDLDDQKIVSGLIKAQIRAENGEQPYTDETIQAGVRAGIAGSGTVSNPTATARAATGDTTSGADQGVTPATTTNDQSIRQIQALEGSIVATKELTAALRDKGIISGPPQSGTPNFGIPGLPTAVRYQMLGAMP
ncbi:hypothetical protein [Castellaniella sp. MT123]|uniref:hypothetical protein n=1 Tax=Castellaniella sp. MT123 TaxID=3140381 RepID=UPI0031F3D3C9